MGETRDIPGWPLYQATSGGRVISKSTGLPVKEIGRKDGYVNVHLFSHKDGHKKIYRLQLAHRLICKAFHGDSDLEVNHLDGNKTNNAAHNLEWTTRSGNILHSIHVLGNRYALSGPENSNAKISLEDHRKIVRWHRNKVLEPGEIAKFFGVNKETVMIHIRQAKRLEKRLTG